MLSSYRKEWIQEAVNVLAKGYSENKIEQDFVSKLFDFKDEEAAYLNSVLDFHAFSNIPNHEFVYRCLENPLKHDYILLLLLCEKINFDVNYSENGQTVFQLITKQLYKRSKHFSKWANPYLTIYRNKYQNQKSDLVFLGDLYKDFIKSSAEFEMWCFARFAYLLEEFDDIKMAYNKVNVLFTILSFKQQKPISIKYPNLLGIANNALHHYGEDSEMIIRAMHVYDVYDKIVKRDQKGAFKLLYNDMYEAAPIQDEHFQRIILKIFPELA